MAGSFDYKTGGNAVVLSRRQHLMAKCDNLTLWLRAYVFFESLATGYGDLQDVLVIGIFEPMSLDTDLVGRLMANLGPSALRLLKVQTAPE